MTQLKSQEMAAEVLAPKVRGTVVLNALCRDEGVDFIVLCSSISSILALPMFGGFKPTAVVLQRNIVLFEGF